MAITYSVSTNVITVTGYTEAVFGNLTDLYNADKAGTLSLHARTGITVVDGAPVVVDRAERPTDYVVLGGASNDLYIVVTNWNGTNATIRITGTDRDGAAQTEDIVVNANGTYYTTKWFKTITHTQVTVAAVTTFDYDLTQGQWGIWSKQGDTQFKSENEVRLIIGDGSTLTWFGDTNKQIEIGDLSGTGWQTFIEKKANANIRFGTVISGERTKDGCCFYHRPSVNYLELVDGTSSSGVVEFLSCCFDFDLTDIVNCTSLKKYNCFVAGDYRIVSNTIDMYNHSAVANWTTFQNCSGTFDRIITTDVTQIFYLGPTATADLTVSNITAKNNTRVATLSNTSYDAYLINITPDTWAFSFASYTGTVYRQYELDLKVTDKDNAAINGATVKIWDKDSNLIVDTTTNASGVIATQTITRGYYNQANGNTLQEASPHLIKIEKAGYTTYEADFTLGDKIDWLIALQAAGGGLMRNPPMTGGMV